jgi:hypothetical protein
MWPRAHEMDLGIGTKVRFVERWRPVGVKPDETGIVVGVEDSSPWHPRVRVRFDRYLSGWIWTHLLQRAV